MSSARAIDDIELSRETSTSLIAYTTQGKPLAKTNLPELSSASSAMGRSLRLQAGEALDESIGRCTTTVTASLARLLQTKLLRRSIRNQDCSTGSTGDLYGREAGRSVLHCQTMRPSVEHLFLRVWRQRRSCSERKEKSSRNVVFVYLDMARFATEFWRVSRSGLAGQL